MKLDPETQAKRRCALPGFDVGLWPTDEPSEENKRRFGRNIVPVSRLWLGAPRDYERRGESDWAHPAHPTDKAGCPGAWYRTPWFNSLAMYQRKRTEGGGRVDNPNLTKCDDPLIQEAIQTLEAYEDEAHAEHMRLYYAKQKEQQKKASR